MIRVFGAGIPGYPSEHVSHISESTQIIARSAEIVRETLGSHARIDGDLHDVFNVTAVADIPTTIADALLQRAENGPVAYVVPGHGQLGDTTVSALASQSTVAITPGAFTSPGVNGGFHQIVDALELAIVEAAAPFDAGLAPVQTTAPLIVTNFYGDSVVPLAASRLSRIYGDFAIEPDATRTLHFLARDPVEDSSGTIAALAHVMARLRSPEGCPWDREQTCESLVPMLREEVEELIEAIESADSVHQLEESGDVLMHIVMLSQIAAESGDYELRDVMEVIRAKMVRRHPHVFAGKRIDSIEELYETWDDIKRQEKEAADNEIRNSGRKA